MLKSHPTRRKPPYAQGSSPGSSVLPRAASKSSRRKGDEVFLPLCKGPRVDFASSGIASSRSASSRSAPRGLEQQRLDQEPACTGDDRTSRLVAVSWRCVRLVAVSKLALRVDPEPKLQGLSQNGSGVCDRRGNVGAAGVEAPGAPQAECALDLELQHAKLRSWLVDFAASSPAGEGYAQGALAAPQEAAPEDQAPHVPAHPGNPKRSPLLCSRSVVGQSEVGSGASPVGKRARTTVHPAVSRIRAAPVGEESRPSCCKVVPNGWSAQAAAKWSQTGGPKWSRTIQVAEHGPASRLLLA